MNFWIKNKKVIIGISLFLSIVFVFSIIGPNKSLAQEPGYMPPPENEQTYTPPPLNQPVNLTPEKVGGEEPSGEVSLTTPSTVGGNVTNGGKSATSCFSFGYLFVDGIIGSIWCVLRIIASSIATAFTMVLALLVTIASLIFNLAIQFSINDLYSYMGEGSAVVAAWKVLRDVTNMLFLMVMMYIAIGTVLQLEGVNWKKQVGAIIMAAVMINFSLAITRIVIDVTNVFALYFYNQAGGKLISLNIWKSLDITATLGLSRIQEMPSLGTILVNTVGHFLVSILAIFVLIMAGVLFMSRSVALIFSAIFSPLPWIGMAVPKFGGKIVGSYWETLINNAIFAPVFMFCLYFVMKFISCVDPTKLSDPNSWWNLGNIVGGSLISAMYYFIVLSLLYGTTIVAKKLSINGTAFAESTARWGTGIAVGAAGAIAGYGARKIGGGLSTLDQKMTGGFGARLGTAGINQMSSASQWVKESAPVKGALGTEFGKKISLQAGMAYDTAKEKLKSPISATGDLLKSVTEAEIIPGTASQKAQEKAEKEYLKKKEVDDAIALINSYAGQSIADGDPALDGIKAAWKKVTKERALEIDNKVWSTTIPPAGSTIAAQWATKDIYEAWSKEAKEGTGDKTNKSEVENIEAIINSNRRNRDSKVAVEGKVAKRDIKADLAATGGANVMSIIKSFMGRRSMYELGAEILNDKRVYRQFDKPRLNALLSAPDDVVSMDDLKEIKADILATTTDIYIRKHLNDDKRWKEF